MRQRRYFIAKHGLDAFEVMPNFVWRIKMDEDQMPHRFKEVKVGDRWIGFAYTTSDNRERPLSKVTGFFECIEEARYGDIPPAALEKSDGESKAWMIEGKEYGDQPKMPVGIPPIDDVLERKLWKNQGLVPITSEDYALIQEFTLAHQFDTSTIPLLSREPENEQELLAIVASCYQEIGIERIIRVRKAFPDLLVQFEGSLEEVHLELELYSEGFINHGHSQFVSNGNFTDGKPVAVLCWIDNKKIVSTQVKRVFELQALIREKEKIVWEAINDAN